MTNSINNQHNEHSSLKTIRLITLVTSFVLFGASMFMDAFCTSSECRTSVESLLLGWLTLLTGSPASISWLANPLLISSWIMVLKKKKLAFLFSILAVLASFSFLCFDEIIKDEAGHTSTITKISIGYWLWLSSCLVGLIGVVITTVINNKKANRNNAIG